MMRFFFLFKFLIGLSILYSCGSITKRDDHIKIDSKPRGLQVKYNQSILGETPLLIERFTHAENKIQIGTEDVLVHCSLDWGKTIIPNTLMAIGAGGLGIYYLVIDYYRDEIRKCPAKLHYELTETKEKIKRKRIIYLPINNIIDIKNPSFFKSVEEKLNGFLEQNDQVIDYDESLEVFLPYGISDEKDWRFKDIDPHVFNKIAIKLGATHIIEVDTAKKEKINIIVYDFYSDEKIKELELFKNDYIGNEVNMSSIGRRFFYLFPNAISFTLNQGGFVQSEVEIDSNTSNVYANHPNTLPGLLKYISIDTVTSPYYYQPYDTDTFFAPSASFSAWRNKVYNLKPAREFSHNVDSITGLFTMDYKAAAITPAGAFSVGLGIGMGIFDIDDEINGKSLYATGINKFLIDYSFFISDRIYFNLGFESFSTGQRVVRIADKEYDNMTITSIGFGYFLPETRLWLDFL